MFSFASKSSHVFAPINGANSFFVHCSAFFRSIGETENDRAEAYVEEIRIGDISYCCLWREEDARFFLDREWRDSSRTCPDRWGSDNAFDLATVIFDDGKPLDLATVRPVGDIIFSNYISAGVTDFGFLSDIAATLDVIRGTSRAGEADSIINSASSRPISELAGGEIAQAVAKLDKLYAERDESEEEDDEREDAIMSWSAVLNGQNRETLSRLTLALSRQLHTLAVKAYADNFVESDIPTLRRLAQLPTCSPAVLTLFYREENDIYPNPVNDPRYVTIDEVIKNITKGDE
jgi:hypothetical protein|nr:MAG TPA: hypothetical protein [Caudoviricetes sp.]